MILLDLTKSYDALEKSRSMEILKGYGVGERVRRMLQEYLEKTTMYTWVLAAPREIGQGRRMDAS